MTPANFGIRLAALAWVVVPLAIVLMIAVSALVITGSDPYSATVWGLYVAAILALPLLGVSLVIGTAGWAWARSRLSASRSIQPAARTGAR